MSSDGLLLVPMWGHKSGEVQSLQTITADGEKKFLPGGRAGGAVFRIGRGGRRWWCEGLATGLSIQAALKTLYRKDEVVVCFSASNLAKVATSGMVVADHDSWSCSKCHLRWYGDWPWEETELCPECGYGESTPPAGEKAARDTGLLYWMPLDAGTDANDYAQRMGDRALAEELAEDAVTATI